MPSIKGRTWDKGWNKSPKTTEKINGGFEDDPRAEEYDKYGRVYNQYNTLPVKDRCWTDEESMMARKRPPKHLFKKKY
tara:strand:+ start:12911 stop:13144 length:234 start_codon:yes stop_codon:yes gene_type:complete